MPPFENVFSWSKSRAGLLDECARSYYYKYYASWGGWDQPKDSRSWQLWMLGKLSNRYMWKGDMVHRAIEMALKGMREGRRLPVPELKRWARLTMRSSFKESLHSRNHEKPKQFFGLFEHEYAEPVQDTTWQELADSVDQCIEAFFRARVWREIESSDPKSWLTIEDFAEFDVEGAPVRLKIDFARRTGPGAYIYDWKTGKPARDADGFQLGLYALFAREKWGVAPDAIHTRYVYLPSGDEVPIAVDESVLERTRGVIRESVARMRETLADVGANLPREEDAFAFAADERTCKRCNFRKVCARFVGAPDPASAVR